MGIEVQRGGTWARMAAVVVVSMTLGTAHAINSGGSGNMLLVDDDNVECPGAPYNTINAALAAWNPGDEIVVCVGTYAEQVVLTQSIPIRGVPVNLVRPVIVPPSLPVTRPTLDGQNPVAAGIVIDGTKGARIQIENIEIDMRNHDVAGCSPIVAGVYARNASGSLVNVAIHGPTIPNRTDCDSGVGLLVESGQDGIDPLAHPIVGHAVVNLRTASFDGFQKAAVAAIGANTKIRLLDTAAVGLGPGQVDLVQNAIQVSDGARGKAKEFNISNIGTAVPGKLASAVLLIGERERFHSATVTDSQVGFFVIGNRNGVAKGQILRNDSDGLIILGDGNRMRSVQFNHAGLDSIFLSGNSNVMQGVSVANTPLGLWNYSGVGNVIDQIIFLENVGTRYRQGDVRNISADTAAPFTVTCASDAECDDANPCTTDSCDVPTGHCSSQAVADGTSCADANVCNGAETCTAGVCTAGTPLNCDDGNECTTDTCDPLLGCQSTPLPDGTPCSLGSCMGGVCM